jgi:hypothetical protein
LRDSARIIVNIVPATAISNFPALAANALSALQGIAALAGLR